MFNFFFKQLNEENLFEWIKHLNKLRFSKFRKKKIERKGNSNVIDFELY